VGKVPRKFGKKNKKKKAEVFRKNKRFFTTRPLGFASWLDYTREFCVLSIEKWPFSGSDFLQFFGKKEGEIFGGREKFVF
jgi:hypothetical protein